MSAGYLVALAVVAGVLLGARGLFGVLPAAGPASRPELVALALGVLGLVLHCGAMFFRSTFDLIPGSDPAISTINAMNLGSRLWYLAAALLVLVGLRGQRLPTLGILTLGLVAVGVTMYDGGPVRTHLVAIFVSVTMLAVVIALLVRLPARPGRRPVA